MVLIRATLLATLIAYQSANCLPSAGMARIIGNVTPDDVYFGRLKEIVEKRKTGKSKAIYERKRSNYKIIEAGAEFVSCLKDNLPYFC